MLCLILLGHIAVGQAKVIAQRHPLLSPGRYYGNSTIPTSQSDATAPVTSFTDIESTYVSFSGNSPTFYSKPFPVQTEPTSFSISEHPRTLFSISSSSIKVTTDVSLSESPRTLFSTSTSTNEVRTYVSVTEYLHTLLATSTHADGGVEQTSALRSAVSRSTVPSPVQAQSQIYSRVTSSDTSAKFQSAGNTENSAQYVAPLETSAEPSSPSPSLPSTTTLFPSPSHVKETQYFILKSSGLPLKSSHTIVVTLDTASQYKKLQDAVVSAKQTLPSSSSAVTLASSKTEIKPTDDATLSQSTSVSTVKIGRNQTEASTGTSQSSQHLTLTDSGGSHTAFEPSDLGLRMTSSALPTSPGRGGDMFSGNQQEQSPKAKATMAGIAVGAVGACAFVASAVFIFFRSYKKRRLSMISQGGKRSSLEIKCIGNESVGHYDTLYARRYR